MPNTTSNLLNHPSFLRFLGFASSIVGFSCYAFGPTFKNMFGDWNWWKILVYSVVSSISTGFILFVKELSNLGLRKNSIVKANVCFLVLMVTSVYSFFQDKSAEGKSEKGYGRMLNLFSFGGFALMSLSLSRQTNIGFEMGFSNFFLASFFVCAMKLNLEFTVGAALICYVVAYIRSNLDSMLEMEGGDDTAHLIIDMDVLNQNDIGSIAENSPSNLDSQTEMQEGRAHVIINTNTLVEITAMGNRGNRETEADNPQVGHGFPSHVNGAVLPQVDSSVNRNRSNEGISRTDIHNRRQVFPQVKVFMSYEGESSLINRFAAALERQNVKIYRRNDEIVGSKAAVIVFSDEYLCSVQRLEELVKIMEYKRRHRLIVIPIFHNIRPTDVQCQTGSYGWRFNAYEICFSRERAQRWRRALREATDSDLKNVMLYREQYPAKLIAEYLLRKRNRSRNGRILSRGQIKRRIFQSIVRSCAELQKANPAIGKIKRRTIKLTVRLSAAILISLIVRPYAVLLKQRWIDGVQESTNNSDGWEKN